ncbi:MAG TPA: sigma-70 family RNA polymerase sigma factor, partial [Gaiellaceae bacterium]
MLYRRHSQRVWRYCLTFLRRPADAEDAVQQTFLQAHRALDRGVAPDSEVAWLLTIARNVCLTRVDASRRRDRAEVSHDPFVLAEVATADATQDGISDELHAALARLPQRQQQALFLREWQECSYAEIAAALGTSEAAVEMLLFRARRGLERELGTRRRARDLVGLLGWLRVGFSKIAVGAALATGAAVGAGTVTLQHRHPSLPSARPHAAPAQPAISQPARREVHRVRHAAVH